MAKRKKTQISIPFRNSIQKKFADGINFRRIENVEKSGIPENRKDRYFKIIEDGKLNDFPQHLINIVEPAPYTRAALDRRRAFVGGKGLSDPDISSIAANDDYNFAEFHRRLAQDFNYSDRLAFLVMPDRAGRIQSVKHIPFEWVRWGVPDDDSSDVWFVPVNPYWRTPDEAQRHTKYYPLYRFENTNISEDMQRITEMFPKQGYLGHVYFFNRSTPRSRHYSRPAYFSAENWIHVDAGIGQFHERNLANNFFIGGIISKHGDPDEGILDANGDEYTTVGKVFAEEVANVASGADNAGNFLIDWYEAEFEQAKFTPWQAANNHEMFIALQSQLREVISVSIGIPQVLLGIQTAGQLGDVQQMRNAILWTNEQTHEWRETLEDTYRMILDGMGVSYDRDTFGINVIQDITDLPQHVFTSMTPAQQQEYISDRYNIEEPERAESPTPLETISENGRDN